MTASKLLPTGGTMSLLPPAPGLCQVCAVQHKPDAPHNAQSLYYGMRFKMLHDRDVTWSDAVAHCSAEVRAFWERNLRELKGWSEAADPIAEPVNADGTLAAVECDRGGPHG